MVDKVERAVAVVGLGAVLPDAPDAPTYWENLKSGRYSISEVPTDRWNPDLYFDPDPKAEDKTYSTIGGWVRHFDWAPLDWRLPIPPKVAESMDLTQKWSVMASREALLDYGYPDRPLDGDRTAVILGNAMAGDMHYQTSMRAYFPEYAEELTNAPSFQSLSDATRQAIVGEMHDGVRRRFPRITEDTMPGELGNIIAGRVANLFNFHGPNFVVDAACASALAAIDAAIEGLEHGDYDAVITGGVDANMGVPSFIKFCKIGALSATGTRPYHEGADGFVMGEGAAVFLLKRLEDAERDGDHIYAVIRGLGGSSDGKGKGITAPNPVGQEFAVARAWRNANLTPNESTYIEGHGTSTRVGDVVEVASLSKVFKDLAIKPGSIPLGSVKSNIGHLKSSAGAAGMLKAIKALDEKVIPASLGETGPNPNIEFAESPLFINKELRDWVAQPGQIRTAGVSAFGFGGTNFHVVLEEYIPGRLQINGQKTAAVAEPTDSSRVTGDELKDPLRGALVIGGATHTAVLERLRPIVAAAHAGTAPEPAPPAESDLRSEVRLAIDYGSAEELAAKGDRAIGAFESENPAAWKALRNRGVFLGEGGPELVAFLYTGQGSQYVNMLKNLRDQEPIVAEMFTEADRIMEPVLGSPLSQYIFADPDDKDAMQAADAELRQTEITQPAVLAVDAALTELLNAYGIHPDMVMGHSLGEYGALVAAKALPFEDALEAVAGRGREMAHVEVEDNGRMTAVFAPLEEIQRVVDEVEDYVVIANNNSFQQAVIGGSTSGVEEASRRLTEAGAQVIPLPVSHAFHTEIVAPASEPLEKLLTRLRLTSPAIPLVANTDGQFYPMGPNVVDKMIDILGDQIASPVQFVTGLQTLYEAGCRTFVEVGPKKALHGLVENVLGDDPEVTALFTNHPKLGDVVAFNQGLCGLYAAGLGVGTRPAAEPRPAASAAHSEAEVTTAAAPAVRAATPGATVTAAPAPGGDVVQELGQVFAEFLAKGYEIYSGSKGAPQSTAAAGTGHSAPYAERPIVITGAGVGLPGGKRVFGDDKIPSLLHGEQMIDTIPMKIRQRVVDKQINRLVKSEAGGGHFETIDSAADVIKLAGRAGEVDLVEEFGFPAERIPALDSTTILAIGAGIDAMRDAGIPLAMHYKHTTTGTELPERWMLPQAYRDTTGVIFASAFPGTGAAMREVEKFYEAEIIKERLEDYKALQARLADLGGSALLAEDLQHRIHELEHQLETEPYNFDRRFLFRGLSMGHSQMAEYIGARGPNTQVNAACASTTQAVALAEDWIRTGRAERVIVVASDDLTADHMLEWFASGFLAVGAAATDELVEDAAVPFDRRRHGMIIGMGAAAIVVEHPDSAAARGIQPISEVLASKVANSAYHGSRLDPAHIREVMEDLITDAEQRWGIDRHEIAPKTVFVSHETYTPARGGSAQAEVNSLRHVFGDSADSIVVANTKGYTGHAMGAGIEDILAIKSLETGIVPPVPNFKERDPDLGNLNLSRGGSYPIEYALRLGAGFGSQVSMTLYRHVPALRGVHPEPDELGFESRLFDEPRWKQWLADVTGVDDPQIEVDRRTLRVRDTGAPARAPLAAQPRRAATPSTREAFAPAAAVTAAPAAPVVAPAAAAPAPAVEKAPAAPPAAPEPATDPVAARVLEIVAGQTGYPPDMLDLDLDLEADLGVDTVKQAETFAAIRDEYNIERDDNLALRDYPTLDHVIGFVRERRPDLAATPAPAPTAATAAAAPVTETAAAAEPAEAPTDTGDPVAAKVLEIVAGQTGYPPDMLDLDLDLEADLGVDTVKQAETFAAIRDEYNIERDDNLALRDYPTLDHVIGFVRERRPDLAAPAEPLAVVGSVETAAATSEAPAGETSDQVTAKVLEIVAGQTGYPPDMLDLDLDLEADLGVDTVKQAETFAAIRDEYNIERDDNLALRDYPTLDHVIGFVRERRPDLAATPAPAPTAATAAAAPVTETAAAAEPAEAPTDTGDPVAGKVLEIVAGQTGYPPDMLDLDLDLEADLGVDTVKQAETFAAIRDEYNIERDDNLALRDYPTLDHVIGFVRERRPDLAPAATPVATAETAAAAESVAAPEAAPAATEPMAGDDAAAAEVPRRVPTPVLRPSLDVCVPSGVSLDGDSRVIVMLDQGGVGAALVKRLEGESVNVLAIADAPEAAELRNRLDEFGQDGPITGVYWLRALDIEPAITDLDLDGWRRELRERVKLLYETMRHLYDSVGDAGTFLVSGTRLGGLHGYGPNGATAPMGGAVTGFTKAFKREKGAALVKAVDFAPSRKTAALADKLIAETLRDPGVVEVGYAADHRWAISLSEIVFGEETPGLTLDSDSVFVVTGAAGSIVSAITADLARASGGTFHLLDLIPEPDKSDPDLVAFATDRDGLKRQIFDRLKESGERATPAMVEKELAGLERSHAALAAIEAVAAAGGTVHYHSVNLLDHDAVTAAMERVSEQSGKVDVLLHAGGLEISRHLPDKERAEFDLVFDVKVDGWFSLISGLGDTPIASTVVFSSVAGRFGNDGQTDYSSANDLLCKFTASQRAGDATTLGVAIDWTAWGDIGMATRGSIPTVMAAAGIDMLPAAAGIPIVRRELTKRAQGGEVVIGLRLGLLLDEFHDTGGLDVAAPAFAEGLERSIMTGSVERFALYGGLRVNTRLDPTEQPFLFDHRIDGTPVLPGVMGVEAFAAAACLGYPDRHLAAIENVDFLAPFKFYRDEPRTVQVEVQYTTDGEDIVGRCELIGERVLAGQTDPVRTVHFRGDVRLSPSLAEPVSREIPGEGATTVAADSIYQIYFHGPAYQVMETASNSAGTVVGRMAGDLPANSSPEDATLVTAPRLTELAFQTAGVHEIGTSGVMALPAHIERVIYREGAAEAGAVALISESDTGFDAVVVDDSGNGLVEMTGYRTVQMPVPIDESLVAPLQTAMTVED